MPVSSDRIHMLRILTARIPKGPPIEEICQGSPFCRCRYYSTPSRIPGGSLLTNYKRGIRTPETIAANTAYMKAFRERKKHGTA